jgi:voltage-gated potassium channel
MKAWFEYLFRRHPIAAFLAALMLVLVTAPLDDQYRVGDLVEAGRLSVLMLLGLLALGGRAKALALGIALVTPALVGKWIFHYRPDLVRPWSFQIPALLFLILMTVQLLKFTLKAKHVDSEVLSAGLAGYLLLGMLWALCYTIAAQLSAGAFALNGNPAPASIIRGFTAIYFSFITLSTIGYGDIVPVSGLARMLAMIESITGTFYMAVMISRLVSLYGTNPYEPTATST